MHHFCIVALQAVEERALGTRVMKASVKEHMQSAAARAWAWRTPPPPRPLGATRPMPTGAQQRACSTGSGRQGGRAAAGTTRSPAVVGAAAGQAPGRACLHAYLSRSRACPRHNSAPYATQSRLKPDPLHPARRAARAEKAVASHHDRLAPLDGCKARELVQQLRQEGERGSTGKRHPARGWPLIWQDCAVRPPGAAAAAGKGS